MFGRILAVVVVLAAAVGLLILAWPQLFGLQRADGIAQAVALRGALGALALLAMLLLVLLAMLWRRARRWLAAMAILLIAFAGAQAWVLGARGFGGQGFQTPSEGAVTVLSWNTLGDAPGPEAIAELVRESGADVVALPETTYETGAEVVAILAAGGTPMQQFTYAYDTVSASKSTTLLVSAELGAYEADLSRPTTAVLPSVVATPVDGVGPTLVAVHAVAPIRGEMDGWREDLEWLAEVCAIPGAIVAGDLNSTVDHWAGLADPAVDGADVGACRDAAIATGSGALGTWPTWLPAVVGAPIDHVLTTPGWTTTGFRVVGSRDGHGSDHRPVLAQLEPAG